MNYVLAVTGSIAAYKSYDVARQLVKNGHQVRVVLTSGALEFIKPETFVYLGVQAVYRPEDDFNLLQLGQDSTVLHVELAKWADKLIIAPLGANTLARLAQGLNNDLLVSLFLALGPKPVLLFPAMNTQMWESPRVQEHVQRLKQQTNIALVNPASGLLACGDIGAGKFPEVSAVVDLIECLEPLKHTGKHVIVTAGATAAPLDPVRYLTNPSSGTMGIAVAKAFLAAGHQVTILAGHQCRPEIENLRGHPACKVLKTPTTEKMKLAAIELFPSADLYISTGAIADIEFDVAGDKIKKEKMGNSLPFHQAADILQAVLKLKAGHQQVVSFAAETETTNEVFAEKMRRKPVDLMVGNKVANGLVGDAEVVGFQRSSGEYFIVRPGSVKGPYKMSKPELGQGLVAWFAGQAPW
jgi:phosphopantothenoylcysteine decarboxylase / phosphopantothenate---cysteine ligase